MLSSPPTSHEHTPNRISVKAAYWRHAYFLRLVRACGLPDRLNDELLEGYERVMLARAHQGLEAGDQAGHVLGRRAACGKGGDMCNSTQWGKNEN
jgi:hypothetical protein